MTVEIEKTDDVWTIIHNRPEARNAMDPASADALAEAFSEFNTSNAKVGVLYGEGGAFCAGWDLKYAQNLGEGSSEELHKLDFPIGSSEPPRGPGFLSDSGSQHARRLSRLVLRSAAHAASSARLRHRVLDTRETKCLYYGLGVLYDRKPQNTNTCKRGMLFNMLASPSGVKLCHHLPKRRRPYYRPCMHSIGCAFLCML